jgi:hypothetical protein
MPPVPPEPALGPANKLRAALAYERTRVVVDGIERKPYVRRSPTLLDTLHRAGLVSQQQAEAGKRYADDHRHVWGSGGSRDSCVLRIGGEVHETERQAEAWAKAKARMHSVLNRCGPGAYALLRRVAVFEERLGRNRGANVHRYRALVVALGECATVYGVPKYD